MTEKPQVDFEEVVKDSGMPVTEAEVRERFNAIAADEGIITNTSRMSPFWRLITAIVTAPVMWLKDVLVLTVLANMFVATASGSMLRLLAWAVNVTAKPASAVQGGTGAEQLRPGLHHRRDNNRLHRKTGAAGCGVYRSAFALVYGVCGAIAAR